ncbi:MAG: peptide/nickel transport system permease protein [Mycobacterium sp.]|jgi:peptide/nickel transport system permease protein|nr:peptide/nickel transport system permease protein [Mycobacterium sp.]
MVRTLLRRLALSIPLIFVVTILTFVVTGLTPGSAAATILGTSATPQKIAALNQQLGLNQPILVQYWHWLVSALHGNLGTSIFSGEKVTTILGNGLPVTLTLIIGAVILAVIIGIPLGVLSARRAKSGGQVIDAVSLVGYAVPNFFVGLILGYVFSNLLNVLPASGFVPLTDSVTGWFRSIVLPIVTIGIPGAALLARQTRQSMLEVLGRDYIRSLRSRGLPEWSVIYKHALRNALGNVITLLGIFIVGLLLATTLVESVFAMQGVGTVAVNATSQHDLPVLEGAALYFTLVVVIAFVLVDLARAWLNPKLRTR